MIVDCDVAQQMCVWTMIQRVDLNCEFAEKIVKLMHKLPLERTKWLKTFNL